MRDGVGDDVVVIGASAIRDWSRRPVGVGVAGLILGMFVAVSSLVATSGDASRMVRAAPPWTDPARTPPGLTVLQDGDGFDGQFFYRLTLDPVGIDEEFAGITYDIPALRTSRATYPVLAWLFSLGGQTALVPWALLLVNVLALGGLSWAAAHLTLSVGHRAGWGLLAALHPGFVYSLTFDLSEIVTCMFGLGALVALHRGKPALSVVALVAAALTRETGLIFALAVLAAAVLSSSEADHGGNRERARQAVVALVAIVAFVMWQLVVAARVGEVPVLSSAGNNLQLPFAGLVGALDAFLPPFDSGVALRIVTLSLIVLVALGASFGARRAPRVLALGWLGALTIVALSSEYVWAGATGFARASSEAVVIGVIVAGAATTRISRVLQRALLVAMPAVWVLTVVAQLGKL